MNSAGNNSVTHLVIGEEEQGQRLDNFLIRICKGVPKSHLYRILRSGEVRVNSGRIDPLAIHPDFTATQNAVEMTLRHPLANSNQKVVETLALLFFTDHQMGDGIVTSTVHFQIYCPRFTSRFARDSEPSDRLPRTENATATRQVPKSLLRDLHKPDQRRTTG